MSLKKLSPRNVLPAVGVLVTLISLLILIILLFAFMYNLHRLESLTLMTKREQNGIVTSNKIITAFSVLGLVLFFIGLAINAVAYSEHDAYNHIPIKSIVRKNESNTGTRNKTKAIADQIQRNTDNHHQTKTITNQIERSTENKIPSTTIVAQVEKSTVKNTPAAATFDAILGQFRPSKPSTVFVDTKPGQDWGIKLACRDEYGAPTADTLYVSSYNVGRDVTDAIFKATKRPFFLSPLCRDKDTQKLYGEITMLPVVYTPAFDDKQYDLFYSNVVRQAIVLPNCASGHQEVPALVQKLQLNLESQETLYCSEEPAEGLASVELWFIEDKYKAHRYCSEDHPKLAVLRTLIEQWKAERLKLRKSFNIQFYLEGDKEKYTVHFVHSFPTNVFNDYLQFLKDMLKEAEGIEKDLSLQ